MKDVQSYDETTEENLFGVPAEFSPRFVSYTVALDNYEPVPRAWESGRLVAWDDHDETRYYIRGDSAMVRGEFMVILDDGVTITPLWSGGHNAGNPAPLYPEGSSPKVMLFPFPVNHVTESGKAADFSNWQLGPRRCYHLKVS